ncbi:MAG: IS4 family transposase [Nanoarchaeota archaeon]
MTTNSTQAKQQKKKIQEQIAKIPFNKLARESGFKKRKKKKIDGRNLLTSFFMMGLDGKASYRNWAIYLHEVIHQIVSPVGVWKRVTGQWSQFLWLVLQSSLKLQIAAPTGKKSCSLFKGFKRVLLQDSTSIGLPVCVNKFFPGNRSKGKQLAGAKIQSVYDLLSGCFCHFALTAYTYNDQRAAQRITSIAHKGDLVIRDLGYMVLNCFRQMLEKDIDFVSRYKYGIKLYDTQTGQHLNLLKLLRKKTDIDLWVIAGDAERLKVRIVAVKLPGKVALERKRKAAQHHNKRLNHSKEYMQLLSYGIYITSVKEEQWNYLEVVESYSFRWRIETIFKCWKSHFNVDSLIPQSTLLTKARVEGIIYAMLIFVTLFQVHFYNYFATKVKERTGQFLSLIKLCEFIETHLVWMIESTLQKVEDAVSYYCRYDKRSERKNYMEKIMLS